MLYEHGIHMNNNGKHVLFKIIEERLVHYLRKNEASITLPYQSLHKYNNAEKNSIKTGVYQYKTYSEALTIQQTYMNTQKDL